jgi:uncharacterized protein YndB with AHSA1/START domain
MSNQHAPLAPVRKQITVACSVEQAFRTFTEGIGTWWPVRTHSITADADGSNPPEAVVFETEAGGRLYERARDGRECDWATILVWEPPHRIVLEWKVNPVAPPTEVEVGFAPASTGTRVELEHRGWERYADGGSAERASYDSGWHGVLGRYEGAVSGSVATA